MIDLLGPRGLSELRKLASSSSLLAFDFDGTLAPIVRHAHEAAMRPRTRRLLTQVALRFPCAVISGRSLSDLRPRFRGVPIRWFIGNHGAEGIVPFPEAKRLRGTVQRWRRTLQKQLSSMEGVWVEDKGHSLAVHYRNSPGRLEARRAILSTAHAFPEARIVRGKCVVNLVMEAAPHKGTALAHLVKVAAPARVLFAGDDANDEDAFAQDLGVPSTTVRVGGKGPSRARYRLDGQDAMDRLLEILLAADSGAAEEDE